MTFAIEYVSKVHLFWMICFLIFFCQYCKNEHFGSTFAKSSMQRDFYKKKKIITVEYVNGTEYHLIQRMIK